MRIGGALALLLGIALATGCSGRPERERGPRDGGIVVMAPAAAEMLDALDATDRIVGIGDFIDRPASILDRPRVGAYDTPSVERVLSVGADLLVTAASQAAAGSHRRLEALGVEVLALDTSTYEGIFASLEALGRAVDRAERAGQIGRDLRERLAAIRRRATGLSPRAVLFVVGREPLYVAGPGSHIDEMIRMVGGTNVAHDALSTYQQLSVEAVLERMPEVIVDTSDNRPGALLGRNAGEWARWQFLPAVANARVYRVHPSRLVIPGLRLPEMTELMGRLVHPEAFGEPSENDWGPLADPAQEVASVAPAP